MVALEVHRSMWLIREKKETKKTKYNPSFVPAWLALASGLNRAQTYSYLNMSWFKNNALTTVATASGTDDFDSDGFKRLHSNPFTILRFSILVSVTFFFLIENQCLFLQTILGEHKKEIETGYYSYQSTQYCIYLFTVLKLQNFVTWCYQPTH